MAAIERRLDQVTAALSHTQQALEESLAEVRKLHAELNELQPHPDHAAEPSEIGNATTSTSNVAGGTSSSSDDLAAIREQQETLQAEIKQHDQIKVETVSKYSVRVDGLVLFNAFSNAGVVDDAGLPSIALPRNPGSSHGSAGVLMRQSI